MHQSALAQPAALLERDLELERVRDMLGALRDGVGEALVVEGAAGMGKSRLLEEARAMAADLGLRVLSARATELEQRFPFGVMRQLFERPLTEADEATRGRWMAGAAGLAEDVLMGAPFATAPAEVPSAGTPGYAWQHGLYWLTSNLAAESPLVVVVDDLQWCDAPSAGALAFIARRLEGQPLALVLATRPLEPASAPVAASLTADPALEVLRPQPLTAAAVKQLIAARLSGDPADRFVSACLEMTGGNPFLLGELLSEAAARGLEPSASAAGEIAAVVPSGVATAVLWRLARMTPTARALARALSVLGDGAQVGDARRLAELDAVEVEAAMAALAASGIVESGGTVSFSHPILLAAVYGDLSPAERERLHRAAAAILRERGAPPPQVAAHVMNTDPAHDAAVVSLLRDAACEALGLGDATGAAALLSRALDEPPSAGERDGVVLKLGQALARAGAPEAIAPLSEIVERCEDPDSIAAAATELSGMLFFAGRSAEGVALLRRAQGRLPAGGPAHERLDVALLSLSYTSVSARREADATIAQLRAPGPSARGPLAAATLATLAMDEAMYVRSAARAADLAERALAAGLPLEPDSVQNWTLLALGALTVSDKLDTTRQWADTILADARHCGGALTVASVSAIRSSALARAGDLSAAEADAQAALELVPDLLGAELTIVLAAATAVLVGLERGETPESLRRLLARTGASYDDEFLPSGLLRDACGVLSAAAGNHEGAVEELRSCELDHPTFGGENPALVPWRSDAALSLADLGRHDEARALAADEVRRAQAFGAPRALGIAMRVEAIVGPRERRLARLEQAREVLDSSPAQLERARVLLDIGATLRAAGKRSAAREPLRASLELAARCGARVLEGRIRAELAAIGVRPRTTDRAGAYSLTPSERRVVDLAAGGGTNRAIAQSLFVTEKTVETHMGRAFRKLDITSRRQLPDVLARASG